MEDPSTLGRREAKRAEDKVRAQLERVHGRAVELRRRLDVLCIKAETVDEATGRPHLSWEEALNQFSLLGGAFRALLEEIGPAGAAEQAARFGTPRPSVDPLFDHFLLHPVGTYPDNVDEWRGVPNYLATMRSPEAEDVARDLAQVVQDGVDRLVKCAPGGLGAAEARAQLERDTWERVLEHNKGIDALLEELSKARAELKAADKAAADRADKAPGRAAAPAAKPP